jgi:uncharacterized membrane protein YoaK (UPF0700 family)
MNFLPIAANEALRMLSHQGSERTFSHNAILAIALSSIAGTVNAAGVFVVGTYTSHVTGNVARFGDELAQGNLTIAYHALWWVFFFFLGAVTATIIVSAARYLGRSRFALALLIEAAILGGFAVLAGGGEPLSPDLIIWLTEMLSFSMGLQNALVTSLSGAVIRTTHLTGVTTDLGIELVNIALRARRAMQTIGLPAAVKALPKAALKHELNKTWLLLCIFISFLFGAVAGPLLYIRWGAASLLIPMGALISLSAFDLLRGAGSKYARKHGGDRPPANL